MLRKPVSLVPVCGMVLLWSVNNVCATNRLPGLHDLDIGYPGSTLSVSPGRDLLAVESNDHLLVLAYVGGRPIADLGKGWQPQWSPSGDRLAFYSLSHDQMQLFTWSRRRQAKQLTNFVGGIDPDFGTRFLGAVTDALQYSWSPDGRTIAVTSRAPIKTERVASGVPLVLTNSTNPDLTWAGVCKLPAVCATGIRLKGRDLIEEPVDARTPLASQVYLVDAVSGEATQLTTTDRVYYDPVWKADGSGLLAVSFEPRTRVADVAEAFSSRDAAPNGQIVSLDRKKRRVVVVIDHVGAARQLTPTTDPDRWVFATSPEYLVAPHLEVASLREGSARVAFSNLIIESVRKSETADVAISYRGKGHIYLADVGADEENLRARVTGELGLGGWDEDTSGGIVWVDQRKNVLISLRRSHPAEAIFSFRNSNVAWRDGDEVSWKNSRGDVLKGGVLLPANYRPGHRYPLIIDAYPLARPRGWMSAIDANQAWAAAGYVIFKPGERAPHVWMNASDPSFAAAGKGPHGFEVALDDVLSGVDELVRRGLVDPDRMCLYGHSNGGSAVSYLVTMTGRFKCAVVVAPATTDWVLDTTLITGGRPRTEAFSGGMDFNRDIDGFVKMSSVFQLYKARTPMLIACGDNDTALVDAISVYNAVRETGTPVTFVRYPGQGHILTGAAMDDFWNRELEFFAAYLHP